MASISLISSLYRNRPSDYTTSFHDILPNLPIPSPSILAARSLNNATDDRNVLNIVWSCLSTLFLCSWVVVHPNIPPPRNSSIQVFGRRLYLTLWQLLAPEMVLYWAIRQWAAARTAAQTFSAEGWTMTHGFYLTMGGFTLYRGEENLGVLSFDKFKELYESGDIDFPTITKDDIDDRSKTDVLSKLITVVQSLWFVAQCISRAVYKLQITELEVVTLAQCIFPILLAYFWWHKPMDIARSTPILLKPSSTVFYAPDPQDLQRAKPLPEAKAENTFQHEDGSPPSRARWYWEKTKGPFKRIFRPIRESRFIDNRIADLRSQPLSFKFFLILLWLLVPLLVVILIPIGALLGLTGARKTEHIARRAPYVPMFYAPQLIYKYDLLGAAAFSVAGSIFGGLHCVAWSFDMPSEVERLLWRMGSVMITAIPCVMCVLSLGAHMLARRTFKLDLDSIPEDVDLPPTKVWYDYVFNGLILIATFVFIVCVVAYPFARLYLFVDAIALLRQVSPSALVEISWTDYVLHL